ncbi:haloacid dehalogenase [Companilactobacillus sp. RD055328]|uniref:YqeG family HAD IIIA-type phosphatase n=1 Tax=Companilactobacillus sp. RD055328 TaxID=2916634 RepID=UPI001FC8657D|nr:YqeG family HAD IIIA-type phosphatase [Companilactobacillus sp. RD055328]GKQ42510.1 haloacid dehalogenase [Companilactobacillus sp. RD055328]
MAIIRPTYMVNSTFNLKPEKLKLMGITHILSDLDNTLIPWNSPEASEELKQWQAELKKYHIELIVVSNNSYDRIHEAVVDMDVKIIARAKKPLPFAIRSFVNMSSVSKERVLFVGDQLLTDVIAGNLSGVRTVMVKPLVDTDLKKTRFNRFFERPILKLINRIYKQTWKDSI